MKHIGTQPIETERLLLRRFTADDAEAMYSTWANDEEVTRFLRWVPHRDVAESRAILQEWTAGYQKDDFYIWAITRKADGALMGSIGILPASPESDPGYDFTGWDPGYCLGRAFWGRGYASEALQAVVDFFTAGTGITTLHCCHAVANPASGRVMQKVGFVYTRDGVYHSYSGTQVPAKYYIYEKK